MAFSYCPHCGFKNMYSLQAPKFCGGCAKPLSILSAAKQTLSSSIPKKRTRKTKITEENFDDDPDGLDIYEVPHISKLSYSVEHDRNKFSLKDMVPLEEVERLVDETPKVKKTRGRPRKK